MRARMAQILRLGEVYDDPPVRGGVRGRRESVERDQGYVERTDRFFGRRNATALRC